MKRRALLVRVGETVPGAVVYFEVKSAPPGSLERQCEQGVKEFFGNGHKPAPARAPMERSAR